MVQRITIAIILLLTAIPAFGAMALKVNLSKPGDYIAWVSSRDGKVGTSPVSFKGKSATLDLPEAAAKSKDLQLFIVSPGTGNMAIRPVENLDEPIRLISSDFEIIRRVRLEIVSDGKPVAAARVSLTAPPNATVTRVLDPTAEGIAEFENVPAGAGSVKVAYGDGKSAAQDIELRVDRETPVFTKEIPVVDAPALAAASAEQKSDKSDRSDKSERHVGGSGFLSGLIGLLFVALIIGVGYVILREKGIIEQIKKNLQGVAETQDQAAEPLKIDDTTCPFCGQKKDASGACACTIAVAPSGMPSTGGAKLVGIGGAVIGQIFPLAGGITIGRDSSNTISLAGDTTASRRHARISVENGTLTATDEGSSNGTYVNGVRITQQALHPGDEIRVGGSLFRMEG